jgi:hypothetical protein
LTFFVLDDAWDVFNVDFLTPPTLLLLPVDDESSGDVPTKMRTTPTRPTVTDGLILGGESSGDVPVKDLERMTV